MMRSSIGRAHLVVGLSALALAAGSAQATATPPAGFPDLSAYAPVDTQTYSQSSPRFIGFDFITPDGQLCGHNTMNSLGDPARLTLSCEGPRPDLGPGTWLVRAATDEPAVVEPSYPPLDPASLAASGARQLPPMHKIVHQAIECGVDDQGMTACRVGDHGFVLTPTSTELF
ncbi:hypothetical protein [Mycolicibacterium pyrenivorans]|uniref:hypothetical protein n=1 Tax=Mycolicibacterium pyrenivorans TaxID=187102 RepID=UPI0021F39C64|nr:hypothetical protein [Mycolicibacterium pyrenivorans]MCV7150103.1 hypothetical protein [Mycolicibacterium pyrenivorans]